MSAPRRTAIRAGWVIAFDGHGHRLLRDCVVVLESDRILQVGPRFDGAVDETVNAADRVVTPGLISTHAHIGGSPLDRSFSEDRVIPISGRELCCHGHPGCFVPSSPQDARRHGETDGVLGKTNRDQP